MGFNLSVLYGTFLSLVIFLIFYILGYSSNFLIIAVVMSIGGISLSFLVEFLTSKDEEFGVQNGQNSILDISHDIMFSYKSLDARLEHGLSVAEEVFSSCGIYVGVCEDNKIRIIKQKTTDSSYQIHEHISTINSKNSIEEMIKRFVVDANSEKEMDFDIDGAPYKAFAFPLVTKTSLEPFGMFIVLHKKKNKVTHKMVDKMRYLASSISFSVNIIYKKDEIMKSNLEYYNKFNEIDEQLNIYNSNKIGKTIQFGFEMHKRYMTPFSMVAFEIDDIKNLSNILSEDELLVIKKDLVSIIKNIIRVTDIFGIWEDDVFVIIAQNVDHGGVEVMVRKIRRALSSYSFKKVKNVSCCYGITSFSAGDTLTDFRSRIFDALREAQAKGNNEIDTQLLVMGDNSL